MTKTLKVKKETVEELNAIRSILVLAGVNYPGNPKILKLAIRKYASHYAKRLRNSN